MMKAKRCKKGKQFVAILLALIMVSGLTVFAAGGETSGDAPGGGESMTSVTESTDTGSADSEEKETIQTPSKDSTTEEDATDIGENSASSEETDRGFGEVEEQNGEDTLEGGGTDSDDGNVGSDDSDTQTEESGEASAVPENSTLEESKDAGDTEVVSVFSVDELAEDTVISSDETKGIAQLENLIPDINFRTEVWRSLSVAGQLGDPEDPQYDGLEGDELYQAVLGNFTGQVYGSGYEKEIQYIYSFQYRTSEDGTWQTQTGTSSSYEGALHVMQTMINVYLASGLEVDQESATVTSQITVTEKRKPDNQLIEDITGVEYLRKAERIDFTDNKITSLMPLDLESIQYRFCNGSFDEARRWFGDVARNTSFSFAGNPITEFPERMPGRMDVSPLFNLEPVAFEKNPVIIVKNPDEDLPFDMTVDMPEVQIAGRTIQFHVPDLIWRQTLAGEEEFHAEYEPSGSEEGTGGSGRILATGIAHSGEATFSIGTLDQATDPEAKVVRWDGADIYDRLSTVSCGITAEVQQQVRVLYEVIPGEPGGTVEISFNKYELGNTESVAGAEYHLFEMEMDGENPVYDEERDEVTIQADGCAVNQDGKVIARPINEEGIQSEYITGENGGFTCNADLGAGTYCFIETESPEGYELNTDPVMFTVETSDTVQISGGDRLAKVELSEIAEETYQLYERETSDDSGTWNLYNNDDELSFSPDEEGVIEIEGLEDGSYQLRPLLTSSEENNIEFKVTGGAVTGISEGISAKAESASYIDRYSDPISITLPQLAEDQQLDSLTIEWYKADNSVEQQIFQVGEDFTVGDKNYENATAENVVEAAEEFVNINKGTADEVGSIQGQVTITPAYKYKPSEPLTTEDPAKVQFSFVKTDGDPSDTEYKGLAGAEFTLYYADDNWEWSEDADGVYKTAQAAKDTGVVSFGDLDSGTYIMKETDAPDGYSALPGYWKITANAWTTENEQKLIFTYVRKAGTETAVSEDNLIPDDAYGNKYYIPNYPIENLPSMGGGGTWIFTAFGLLFTGTAIMLFVCARRNKKGKGV